MTEVSRTKKTTRCVHCRTPLVKETRDHVFPSSWYPATTPPNVQRWTAPSCADCNGKYGEMEKELFIRAALCVGPEKAEAAGLSKKAVKSLGVGTSGLTLDEKKHREALKNKILKVMKPYAPGTDTFPGMGAHKGFPEHAQYAIQIPEALLKEVAAKIVRGCEYILGNCRIIEDPDHLRIYFAHEHTILDRAECIQKVRFYLTPWAGVSRK